MGFWHGVDYNHSAVYLAWVRHSYTAQTTIDSTQTSPDAVLESGASSSVAGLEWDQQWLKCRDAPLPMRKKRFKFGPHDAVRSLGPFVVRASIMVLKALGTYAERPIDVEVDIVRGSIHCLIFRERFPLMG